jgi:hypothetical protein
VHLTERGQALLPVIRELGRWGAPLLAEATDADVFRSYWLQLPLDLYYADARPDEPPVAVELRLGDDEPVVVETRDGMVHARRGSAQTPAAVVSGPPRLVIGLLSGRVDLDEARRQGVRIEGDARAVTRIHPAA